MVFTTSKIFTKNKQFVCLAMRQSLRNLFDLLQKHEELKRDEYEANRRYELIQHANQIVSVGKNRLIVPGYMEMNHHKYTVILNNMNTISIMTIFFTTTKRIILWIYEIFC
jgi:3-polyprenyl-4-hydroxybenzoate decarboxylase